MEVLLIFKLNHFYMYLLLKKKHVVYDQICFYILNSYIFIYLSSSINMIIIITSNGSKY